MKKYITLSVMMLSFLFTISFIPSYIASKACSVRLTSLKSEVYCDFIFASGSIEQKQKSDISLQYPVVVKKINFSVGDNVKKGDVIAVVDKDETVSCIKSLSAMSSQNLGEYASVYNSINNTDEISSETIPENITATEDGTLSSLDLEVGSPTTPKKSIATISKSDSKLAKIQIKEIDISKVKVGQKVEISGSGFVGKQVEGKISKIFSTARKQYVGASSETVIDAIVDIGDLNTDVKSGFNVTSKIFVDAARTINTIPFEAICQDENNNEFVYTFNKGLKKRILKLGVETQNGVEVLSGLSFSDIVVLDASKIKSTKDIIRIRN
jgi:HlyD family secretion protein